MPNLSFYERQHLEKLIQQEASLKYIFDEYVRNVSILMSGWQDSGNENVWIRNAHIEKGVEKELQALHSKLTDNIKNYSIDAWNRSNRKTDDLIEAYIKDIPLNNVTKKGLFARNEEALEAFLKAKIDGETMSDRVWKVAGTGKENIEHYLSSGISTGRPATLISQDMRQLLKDPDKLFHRIRNADGKLVPSAPMKAYHPGTGVYRSSFMNAKRLAATETNMAYRTADHERWKKLDFVLGIEVRRSNSNKGPCPVCDALVGRYPKDYKYRGFHPFCICVATPILMDEDKFISYLVEGNLPNDEFIKDIPNDARKYLEEQLQKGKVSSNSYLFKNNSKFFNEKSIEKNKGEKQKLNIPKSELKSQYSEVLKNALISIIGIQNFSHPAFKGEDMKFTRNSFTENLSYSEAFFDKAEILKNPVNYLKEAEYSHFETNIKPQKTLVAGYFVFKGIYKGKKVEYFVEKRKTGELIFHFIKFIK